MAIGSIIDIAEDAMTRDSMQMTEIAHEIANSETSETSIEENIVDMIQTQNSFQANAVMITTADEMMDTLFNM